MQGYCRDIGLNNHRSLNAMHNKDCSSVCVWEGGGEGEWRVFVGVSCLCVWANVYVCICHSHDCKVFLAIRTKIRS